VDQVPEETPTRRAPRRRLDLRQIGGLPPVYSIPLAVSHVSQGVRGLVQPTSGMHVGYLLEEDGVVGFQGVVCPDFEFTAAILRVEFTSVDTLPEDPSCSVSALYLDRAGKVHKQFTPPLVACGDLAEFHIPAGRLARSRVLTIATGFALTSFMPQEGDEPARKRPILFRGAWLEFPE
jgi:hypothetical protein